uniref:Plexin b1b n=1 Tax=Cyprinodon variegatus TaxID=28743 RepID=A0A3Q2D9K7_CYPVA
LKTLLNDLVEQYVAKNPKLMLRRTESVVEKLLTNWMSICLYTFLRDSAGESLFMLFKAIKHQVDKGPVDAVTRKAKYTLNDNRLLREDVEYKTLTLNVLVQGGGVNESQPLPCKVLDCDTITQVKEKLLDQVFKSTSFSHRPHADSLDLGENLEVWCRRPSHPVRRGPDVCGPGQLEAPQHAAALQGDAPSLIFGSPSFNRDSHAGGRRRRRREALASGEGQRGAGASQTPQRQPEGEGASQGHPRDLPHPPALYEGRLILSTSRPVPLAVKYFFDLLDDQAGHHSISDPETIHIWKTNSLPLRFWINIIKNPQFIFDVQVWWKGRLSAASFG